MKSWRSSGIAALAFVCSGCGTTVIVGGVPPDARADVATEPDAPEPPPPDVVVPDVSAPDVATPDRPAVDVAGSCDGGAATEETCNGVDDDCDGLIDDGLARRCYGGPAGTMGVGTCRAGTEVCVGGTWSACTGEVTPRAETCDGADDDCDGTPDDALTRACGDAVATGGTRYVRSASPRPFLDACAAPGHRTFLMGVDDGNIVEAYPFTFTAWGRPADAAWISANGVVTFMGMVPPFNATLPITTASVDRAIFAFWDDLFPRMGVCTTVAGAAPSRAYVVEWADAGTFPMRADVHLTFEVVLDEATGAIDVIYRTMEGAGVALGESATIGIQGGATADLYDLVSFNRASATPLAGTGIRWAPQPGAGRGICRAGTQTCAVGAWGTCVGAVGPMPRELCRNALDDDCNGLVDDGCP
ncbi:MAG: MopE-related protein [Polyangiales bacterium]